MTSLFCLPYMILSFQFAISVNTVFSYYKLNSSVVQSVYHEEVNPDLSINSIELREISLKLHL